MAKNIHWTPKLVQKFWGGVAGTELDEISFGKIAGPQFIDAVQAFLAPGGRHLDFGAGSGHVLQILLEKGFLAAGFDPSLERSHALVAKIGQREKFLGVVGTNSLEQFDVVLCMEVAEHLLDQDFTAVIDRVSKFVKPGGYLIASTPNNENLRYASVYCPVCDTSFHPWQHVRNFSYEQFETVFRGRGFSTEYLALLDFSNHAQIYEDHKKWEHLSDEINALNSLFNEKAVGSIYQAMRLKLKNLLHHRKIISTLYNLSRSAMSQTEQVKRSITLRKTSTSRPGDSMEGRVRPAGQLDCQIGLGTTIVYVGKKN